MVNSSDLVPLSPLLLTAGASILVMLLIAVYRNHTLAAVVSLMGLATALLGLSLSASRAPRQVTPLLLIDDYAVFYMGLILAATFAVVMFAHGYLEKHHGHREEFYVLLLVAALGSMVLVCSNHFVSFFLGLETLSIALYTLIAYPVDLKPSLEAAIKYLVLAAASSAFLLFGMALVYAELGTMEFGRIAVLVTGGGLLERVFLLPGTALIITGIGFKLAVVPFHMWTPDVYQGAPAPVTAFVATVSKGGIFALLLRYFQPAGVRAMHPVFVVFAIIAVASMFAGNLLALLQTNVKRILAYSSIAHLGYLLVAFQAGGSMGTAAATFYLVAYFITILGAFGVVSVLSRPGGEAEEIDDYRGLFWRRPWLAGVFTAMLLSLAGIPLTAGFLAKFYLVAAGASSSLWGLVFALIVTSAIGLFYYLRIIVAVYQREGEVDRGIPTRTQSLPPASVAALSVLTILLLWLGVYPVPVLDAIQTAVARLV